MFSPNFFAKCFRQMFSKDGLKGPISRQVSIMDLIREFACDLVIEASLIEAKEFFPRGALGPSSAGSGPS